MGGAASSSSYGLVSSPRDDFQPADTFPRLGITVHFLQEFVHRCGGFDRLQGLNCYQVVEKFIKKPTKWKKSSYCEWLLQHYETTHVGYANAYISHAWSTSFLSLVECLQHHFRFQPNIIIWLDMFSFNQHQSVVFDENWWLNLSRFAINHIGYTVMVFSSVQDTEPLSRAWCLYELFVSFDTNVRFEMALAKEQQQQLLKSVSDGSIQKIHSWFSNIDIQRSKSSKEQDKMILISALNQIIEFEDFNRFVEKKLRQSFIHFVHLSILKPSLLNIDKQEEASIYRILGKLYEKEKMYDEAEKHYLRCIELRRKHGAKSTSNGRDSIAQVIICLADLYDTMNQVGKAQELYTDYLNIMKEKNKTLGDQLCYDRQTLIVMNNLAMSYAQNPHTLNLSKDISEDCLQKALRYLPANDTFLLQIGMNLAFLYERLLLYEEAESMYLFCMEKEKATSLVNGGSVNKTKKSGRSLDVARKSRVSSSSTTVTSITASSGEDENTAPKKNKAKEVEHFTQVANEPIAENYSDHDGVKTQYTSGWHQFAGQLQQAEHIYLTSLQHTIMTVGESHPHVSICLNNLAHLYESEGKFEDATFMYTRCLNLRRAILGATHPFTLISMSDLARLHMMQENYDLAISLFDRCLEERRKILGEHHPHTLLAEDYILRCRQRKGINSVSFRA